MWSHRGIVVLVYDLTYRVCQYKVSYQHLCQYYISGHSSYWFITTICRRIFFLLIIHHCCSWEVVMTSIKHHVLLCACFHQKLYEEMSPKLKTVNARPTCVYAGSQWRLILHVYMLMLAVSEGQCCMCTCWFRQSVKANAACVHADSGSQWRLMLHVYMLIPAVSEG